MKSMEYSRIFFFLSYAGMCRNSFLPLISGSLALEKKRNKFALGAHFFDGAFFCKKSICKAQPHRLLVVRKKNQKRAKGRFPNATNGKTNGHLSRHEWILLRVNEMSLLK